MTAPDDPTASTTPTDPDAQESKNLQEMNEGPDKETGKIASEPDDTMTSAPTSSKTALRKLDFGFLPIPRWRRYDPDIPFKFSPALNYLFALAAIATVANLSVSSGTRPQNPSRRADTIE
jgi:hypothetical protein